MSAAVWLRNSPCPWSAWPEDGPGGPAGAGWARACGLPLCAALYDTSPAHSLLPPTASLPCTMPLPPAVLLLRTALLLPPARCPRSQRSFRAECSSPGERLPAVLLLRLVLLLCVVLLPRVAGCGRGGVQGRGRGCALGRASLGWAMLGGRPGTAPWSKGRGPAPAFGAPCRCTGGWEAARYRSSAGFPFTSREGRACLSCRGSPGRAVVGAGGPMGGRGLPGRSGWTVPGPGCAEPVPPRLNCGACTAWCLRCFSEWPL